MWETASAAYARLSQLFDERESEFLRVRRSKKKSPSGREPESEFIGLGMLCSGP